MRYEIKGETLPVVICYLDAGEKIITENGGMSWMSPNMEMKTSSNGGIGKMFGRMFSGEKMFQNVYTAKGEEGMIAFASCFPGSIRAFDVSKGDMVLQKKAFLASEAGVELSVFFNKRVGSGLFGGEGFIMQRLSGKGIAFAEFDGHVVEYDLEAGQQLVVDTGHLAAMSASCKMEIRSVPGVKNMLFGGEGIFNTVIYGHNMKNGSMFNNIKSYTDQSFADEHPYVYIYLPDGTVSQYKVVVGHIISESSVLYSTQIVDTASFVQEMVKTSSIKVDFDQSQVQSVITLSTCTSAGSESGKRNVVHAILQRKGIDPVKEKMEN